MAKNRRGPGGGKNSTSLRDTVGSWEKYLFEPVYGSEGNKFSDADILERQEFKRAWGGDLQAIRGILSKLTANIAVRESKKARFLGTASRSQPSPVALGKADPALLLLGIGAVDNEELAKLGEPGDPRRERGLKTLRPNGIEQWVVELAKSQPGFAGLSEWEEKQIARITTAGGEPEFSKWHAGKQELIAELMAVRGPGATKIKPGTSGNPSGRLPGCRGKIVYDEYPFDGFFMEVVEAPFAGKLTKMTRLDALMRKLTLEACKGDEKLSNLLAPIVARLRKLHWESQFDSVPINDIKR